MSVHDKHRCQRRQAHLALAVTVTAVVAGLDRALAATGLRATRLDRAEDIFGCIMLRVLMSRAGAIVAHKQLRMLLTGCTF
jgi:hypothetical protein